MRRLILVLAPMCWVGCQADQPEPSTPGLVVRDSAGIQIVESRSPAWSPDERWQIGSEPIFVLRGSDGGDESRLLDPTSIDVDARGRVIVGDGNQFGWNAVLVYDSLGTFQFQAGREGHGPGEFGQLSWASAYRSDSIVAFDKSGDRLNIFTPDGDFVREVRTPPLEIPRGPRGSFGYPAGAEAAYGDGYFLAYPRGRLDVDESTRAGPAWDTHLLLRVTPTGEAWDTLGSFEISEAFWSGTSQEMYWFGATATIAVGREHIYFGRGDTFEVGVYDRTGRLIRIVRRTHTPQPVTNDFREQFVDRVTTASAEDDETVERVRIMFESGRFASTLPPYSTVLLGEAEYLWVNELRWISEDESDSREKPQWSVFDSDGAWLGRVETPPGFILRKVTRDRVLGFMIDEYGLKEVHAYPLDRRR